MPHSQINFRQFFDDFSGYRHARAKISTVLESAHQDRSDDTHKAMKVDEKKFTLTRWPENLKMACGARIFGFKF